jgi:hypothetical protein
MKELLLVLQSHDGRKGKSLIAHHASFWMDGQDYVVDAFTYEHPERTHLWFQSCVARQYCGLGSGTPWTLRVSGLGRGCSLCFKVAMGEKARNLIVHHVSLLDGWLRLLRDTMGPGPGRLQHFTSRSSQLQRKVFQGRDG